MEEYYSIILIHYNQETTKIEVDVHEITKELSEQLRSSKIKSHQWLSPNDALELSLEIHPDDLPLLKTFKQTSQGHAIAFIKSNAFYRHKRLVVFDMDSTLIQQECIDELARIASVVDQVSVIYIIFYSCKLSDERISF
jgi:hypothetical protein